VLAVLAVLAVLVAPPAAVRAQEQLELPANALNPLVGLTGVAAPENLPAQRNAEPPLDPVAPAVCAAGSRPLVGEQGRVPPGALEAPAGADGYTCNLAPVGRLASGGGWKVWRYVDRAGRECAYHDASDPHPLAAGAVGLPKTGVAVLDMSDPARPRKTALLRDLPMQTPHESLNLNERRGLLIAEMGSGGTMPGLLSIYDVSEDCRRPVHRSTTLAARFGHESGFSPDGRTFWMAGGVGLAAIDVSDPAAPRKLWEGALYSHGLSLSADGNRAYVADPINAHLVVLDVSEVQARRPDAEVREISRLTWRSASIPQNTAPITVRGRPYVLEFDEFAFRFTGVPQDLTTVGGARIVDIAEERRPRVVANLRLAIHARERQRATLTDTGPLSLVRGYSAHYCAVPREVDPQIVACSFIASGLRIFDIRDPLRPREVAYHVAAPRSDALVGDDRNNAAMSKPAFVPERREVWYTDVNSGFHAVRLNPQVWPDPTRPVATPCVRRRSFLIRVPGRPALRSFSVRVSGRRARATRVGRGVLRVRLLAGDARRVTIRIRAVTRTGRRVRLTRRVSACRPHGRAAGRIVPAGEIAQEDDDLVRAIDLICALPGSPLTGRARELAARVGLE